MYHIHSSKWLVDVSHVMILISLLLIEAQLLEGNHKQEGLTSCEKVKTIICMYIVHYNACTCILFFLVVQ